MVSQICYTIDVICVYETNFRQKGGREYYKFPVLFIESMRWTACLCLATAILHLLDAMFAMLDAAASLCAAAICDAASPLQAAVSAAAAMLLCICWMPLPLACVVLCAAVSAARCFDLLLPGLLGLCVGACVRFDLLLLGSGS